MEKPASFNQWCLVEVMGHQRYAGLVTEEIIAGAAFVRVDVPAVEASPGFTKFIGTASIYAITPLSEELVRNFVRNYTLHPVEPYLVAAETPTITWGGDRDED